LTTDIKLVEPSYGTCYYVTISCHSCLWHLLWRCMSLCS